MYQSQPFSFLNKKLPYSSKKLFFNKQNKFQKKSKRILKTLCVSFDWIKTKSKAKKFSVQNFSCLSPWSLKKKIFLFQKRKRFSSVFCIPANYNEIQDYYKKLEIKDYVENNNFYLQKHAQFLEENKMYTEKFIYDIFLARVEFVLKELAKKRLHLLFARLFYNLKYPCKKTASIVTLKKNMELRYQSIRNFDVECQSLFELARQLRDLFIFKWIYIHIFQPLITFSFLTYVYTAILPNSFSNILAFWIFLTERFAFLNFFVYFWQLMFPFLFSFLALWLCVFFVFFLSDETFNNSLEKGLCFLLLLFIISSLCFFFWLFLKNPALFLIFQYFLFSFNFFEVK